MFRGITFFELYVWFFIAGVTAGFAFGEWLIANLIIWLPVLAYFAFLMWRRLTGHPPESDF